MSTVTYVLNNGVQISRTWDNLNAFEFLTKVHDEGLALDEILTADVEIVSINIKYNFPKHLRLVSEVDSTTH